MPFKISSFMYLNSFCIKQSDECKYVYNWYQVELSFEIVKTKLYRYSFGVFWVIIKCQLHFFAHISQWQLCSHITFAVCSKVIGT